MFSMSDIVISSGWRSRLEELVGTKRQTALLVAALGAAAVVGLIAAGGRTAAQVAPPARSNATALGPTPAAQPTMAPTLFVHVSGAVRAPGLFELVAGSRVADAVELAGGATERAQVDSLNLAELLADGMKVHVPEEGEMVSGAPMTGGVSPSPAPVIDINLADVAMLETIPGIGPTRAAAIVSYREQAGGFDSVDQLLEVQGIGPATLEALREYVTV
jgi:competence protein ComEA